MQSSEAEVEIDPEVLKLTDTEVLHRARMIGNETRIMKSEINRLNHEKKSLDSRLKDNTDKIKLNKQLPYLVSSVQEVLNVSREKDEDEDESTMELESTEEKAAIIRTSTRQIVYLPMIGFVPADELTPNDLVGVNKDSYLILEKLPTEYDSRVKAMEVDEKPKETYPDVGGLDKQIMELHEAVVLPMEHPERFKDIGITPTKGVLLYGPPGTGKTLLARAVANETNACFLRLAGPQLVQMYIGEGSKMVRDAFALAITKAPAIIFIDELDAIGMKRFDNDRSGDREVQRTMLELLNQLDGFSSDDRVKVIAATNRIDILDPALLRSGRLDRKIEFPLPTLKAREQILIIHSRKMNCEEGVDFKELARSTEDFNGAQLKAVCIEAGMVALRREAAQLKHEDFVEGINQVQEKKKSTLKYFT